MIQEVETNESIVIRVGSSSVGRFVYYTDRWIGTSIFHWMITVKKQSVKQQVSSLVKLLINVQWQ